MLTKPYPKDNEPRTMGLPARPGRPARRLRSPTGGLKPGDLLFATRDGTPFSRNTFRTRVWRPAVAASGVDFDVRVHDLRHAHASWLLAGGSDLKSVMDRMGHAQITTTQKYLHTLPDADTKNLTALDRIRNPPLPDHHRRPPDRDELISHHRQAPPARPNGHQACRTFRPNKPNSRSGPVRRGARSARSAAIEWAATLVRMRYPMPTPIAVMATHMVTASNVGDMSVVRQWRACPARQGGRSRA